MLTEDEDARSGKTNPHTNFINQGGMKPVNSMSPVEIKSEKMRIWKNITVISLSFMCLFTAYNSVFNLQVTKEEEFLKMT